MICYRDTRTDRPQGIEPAENSTVQKGMVDHRSRVDGHESNQSPKSVTSELLELAKTGKPDRVLRQYVWGARPGHRDELVLRDRATVSSEERDGWDCISIENKPRL